MERTEDLNYKELAPLVSVVLAVFNEEQRLDKTVRSILEQTFKNFEFIIIDDGSTDHTLKLLKEYEQRDKRIILLINHENLGLTKSINKGLKIARGDYIARIDGGDKAHPDRIKTQIEFMENNPAVYMVGTFAYWIDNTNKIIGRCRFPIEPEQVRKKIFGQTSVALHPSLLIRRALFAKIGLFDERYKTSMEYELYHRTISNNLDIANIPDYLMYILRDNKGVSVDKIKTEFINQFKIRSRYLFSMLTLCNVYNTVFSFIFIITPTFILRKIVDVRINFTKST